VAALKASVAALTALTSADAGTGAVMTAVTDVKTSVEGLLVSGKEAAAKPLASLQAAVDALQATISGLASQPTLGAKVTAVKAAITQVASAAVDVEAALATTCPAS
jgi:CHASE3 domain sensor protein